MGRISKLDDFRKINKRYVAVPCPTCRTTGACDR
jgi:Fe-S oxidoreductase